MTALELERVARSIVPPVGATAAIARVDDQLKHRVAFLIDGRIHGAPVGPGFDRPRDAIRLVDLLNGEAPRSTPAPDLARVPGGIADRRDEDPASSKAPVMGSGAGRARPCVVCGRDLPSGSRLQRRTDTDACRRALARQDATKVAGADTDSGRRSLSQFPAVPGPAEAVPACSHPDWRIDYLNGPTGPVIGPLGAHRVLPVCTECGEPIAAFLDQSSETETELRFAFGDR